MRCGAGSMKEKRNEAEEPAGAADYTLENGFFFGFSAVNLILSAALLAIGSGAVSPDLFGQCAFLSATGFYCPGCGGTRALFCLARGDWLGALGHYPALVYYVLLSTVFLAGHGIRLACGGALPALRIRPVYFAVLLALILGGWAVRNLVWGIWGIPI